MDCQILVSMWANGIIAKVPNSPPIWPHDGHAVVRIVIPQFNTLVSSSSSFRIYGEVSISFGAQVQIAEAPNPIAIGPYNWYSIKGAAKKRNKKSFVNRGDSF